MPWTTSRKHRGFSLLELVIVVVIIGIIAAIAIPRMSRGTAGAADSALAGDLAVMRNAIDLFAAEHGGKFPTLANVENQLKQYTDDSHTSAPVATKDATHIYGPYLREVPPLPVGANKGKTTFTGTAPAGSAEDAGWYYNENTGEIRANCTDTETDESGTPYNEY
jgi:prepilin-type N-terminal cleavage/methylation domain-containing protein